jgi:hypothetical protein
VAWIRDPPMVAVISWTTVLPVTTSNGAVSSAAAAKCTVIISQQTKVTKRIDGY